MLRGSVATLCVSSSNRFTDDLTEAEAVDEINDKYGKFVITPALMMGMDDTIIDRTVFGGVKELEELYL
jgi:hypothetical protein